VICRNTKRLFVSEASKMSISDPFNPVNLIAVGTTNKCKLAAVKVTLEEWGVLGTGELDEPAMQGYKVPSEISEQPMSLEETYKGAMNRARNAYTKAKADGQDSAILAFGIESGLNFTPDGRAYDLCVCSAYDGMSFNQGMSCAFEIPPAVLRHIQESGMDLSQASNASGLSSNPELGEAEGIIGILSRGRVTRFDYTKQAVAMALMLLENSELYPRESCSKVRKVRLRADKTDSLEQDLVTPLRARAKASSTSAITSDALRAEGDRKDCTARLVAAARSRCGTAFDLPLASLVAAFGSGDPAADSFYLDCTHTVDADGRRSVTVESAGVAEVLGDSPLAACIGRMILEHDGVTTAKLYTERAKGQTSLAASLANGSRPSAQSLAAAAAVKAAEVSSKDPFVVESDGSGDESSVKRRRNK